MEPSPHLQLRSPLAVSIDRQTCEQQDFERSPAQPPPDCNHCETLGRKHLAACSPLQSSGVGSLLRALSCTPTPSNPISTPRLVPPLPCRTSQDTGPGKGLS